MGLGDRRRERRARLDASDRRKAVAERLRLARQGRQLAAVGNVYLFHDRVVIMGSPPVRIMLTPGTVARVDAASAGTGEARELYLVIEDPAAGARAKLPPDEGPHARRLAVHLANAVSALDAARVAHAARVASIEAELDALDDDT